jgi:RNA polymerase sigma-70 factor (ECF subfamily)
MVERARGLVRRGPSPRAAFPSETERPAGRPTDRSISFDFSLVDFAGPVRTMPAMVDVLGSAFLAVLPEGCATPPELPAALDALLRAGRGAWPGLAVDAGAFARHLASLATPAAPLPDPAFAADVYLATACTLGVAGAAAALTRAHGADLGRALARAGGSAAAADDARQIVWEKLLVSAAGRAPKIAGYGGRAPLKSFLRTVAVRTAIDLRRRKDETARDGQAFGDLALGDAALGIAVGPELDYLTTRYKAELSDAVRRSLAALSLRERTILRLHLEQRMNVDALGAHYGVGRSTASRWLQAARNAVAEGARAELTARLGLTPSELRSVVRLVQSKLDVSVLRILVEADAS